MHELLKLSSVGRSKGTLDQLILSREVQASRLEFLRATGILSGEDISRIKASISDLETHISNRTHAIKRAAMRHMAKVASYIKAA